MTLLQIQLLGKASINDYHQAGVTIPAKAQELFFYLLLHSNRPHERETLSTLLWADISADKGKKYLRQALWQLQSALDHYLEPDAPVLRLEGSWVLFDLQPIIWLDIDRLQHVFSQVHQVAGQALTAEQAADLRQAIDLYQGELLAGWYQDWCIIERERYQSMHLALLDKLIDYCMTHDQIDQGIDYAHQLLRYDHARERTHRRLMRLYYLANRRTAALRQFERCTAALAAELGVQPGKRTIALHQQIQADHVTDLWQIQSSPRSFTEPEPPSSVLMELKQITARLATLQIDIQTIKHAINGSKDASTDAERDASTDAGLLS